MAHVLTFGTKYTDLDQCLLDYLEWYRFNEARVVSFESAQQFLRLAMNGRVYLLHLLRDGIMALRSVYANVTDLDQALDAYTTWYANNAETITDPLQFVTFAKKANDDCLHLIHMLRTELRNAESQTAQDSLLTLPLIYR
jgi:hypothetical protein